MGKLTLKALMLYWEREKPTWFRTWGIQNAKVVPSKSESLADSWSSLPLSKRSAKD